ncbi:CPBP family intramembrane glutamic endopeptidase [Pseudoalteromonas byunsanensis]|uniref:CAAX prenyl protease 2/Lysostaphin resistance protein A-like domain-containing protein n=1 Tax=Pseudoalteromonas byunsanensis TaxID=327939 RepID=A0A1S1N6W1_9GAMM|nr:CPBP family intramembrane glutamic endopeptidase [Pseudoalteromonas byunsanensis]OHU95402.1 hypothetical protein BIW53_11875 [Pseudoalteromonas byunsanensis]
MIRQTEHYFGFIGTLLGGALILFLFILVQDGVSSHYVDTAKLAVENKASDAWVVSIATFASFLVCSTLIFILVRFGTKDFLQYLAIKASSTPDLVKWLGVTALFLLVSHSIMYAMDKPFADDYAVSLYTSADALWLLLIAVIIIAPLFEELFFRGYLFHGFSRSFLRPAGAVVLTSLLWGMVHPQYELYLVAIIFCQGIMLCLARMHTNSILTCVLMHALINTTVVLKTIYYVEFVAV